ncbi:hypothetical protein Nepgr_033811 [Nepenthes gracilis]|uniref:3'-5' exonuclease domain-containing protein n=1 Tax=Nepenthes gracilis TaxID=150966 RepID=A0AAD3TN20_NEPGR|nr:hypothetical protein Nepgr_033811 [Nepenthes gracilis]
MGKYDIKFVSQSGQVEMVKVEVLDSAELIKSWITERLQRMLQEGEHIVGLDLQANKNRCCDCSANSLLVIYINNENCLVVQLKYVGKIPEPLKKFLGNRRICFMGVGLDRKLSRVPHLQVCRTVELSYLAARIRKEQSYCNSDLRALAALYEVPYEPLASGACCCGGRGRINYEARVFLNQEVKALVRDAYVCYKIWQRLVEALPRERSEDSGARCLRL